MKLLFKLACLLFGTAPQQSAQRSAARTAEFVSMTTASLRRNVPSVESLRGTCYVVDGDTIVIKGRNIRLAGIDAPEMDHPYGRNARWALVELCRGLEVTADHVGELSFDRLVATCRLPDGRDLSAEMVKLGMALDWRKYSGGRYRHLEPGDARKKLWRCDARQKGRMPPRTF